MPPMLSLLNEMRGRLGMFLGSTSLTKLAAFLRGYEHALLTLRGDAADHFLAEFRDWIQERFGDTSKNWEDIILSQTEGEQAAVRVFWQLLDEYLEAQKPPVARQPIAEK